MLTFLWVVVDENRDDFSLVRGFCKSTVSPKFKTFLSQSKPAIFLETVLSVNVREFSHGKKKKLTYCIFIHNFSMEVRGYQY